MLTGRHLVLFVVGETAQILGGVGSDLEIAIVVFVAEVDEVEHFGQMDALLNR